jgi:hypothetical protein
MRLTRPRLRALAAAAIGAGAALALVLPAGADVSVASQSPPVSLVQLDNQATVDSNGAVTASVRIDCSPVPYYSFRHLSVSVTEKVNGAIASGTTAIDIESCDGAALQLPVAVMPTQRPFKKGVAFGQASLQLCQYQYAVCITMSDQHDIQIVKP